jgi:hypothetical protein
MKPQRTLNLRRIVVDIIWRFDAHNFLFFLFIEQAKSKLVLVVEAKSTDRLSVVVVEQNGTVALRITHNYSLR